MSASVVPTVVEVKPRQDSIRGWCDADYREWENAEPLQGDDFWDLIEKSEFFEGKARNAPVQKVDGKAKLFVAVNVWQLDQILPSESQFSGRFRVYLAWSIDYEGAELTSHVCI